MQFINLFEPVNIGTMRLRNRIVMAATGTNFPGDGTVTDRAIAFYRERAKGGAGLIVVEGTGIDPLHGLAMPNQVNLFDDRFIPSFKRLVRAMRDEDAKTCIQLSHPGALASSRFTGKQPLSPSGISIPGIWEIPKAMTSGEIEAVIRAHIDAARRARESGFDSVQIIGHEGLVQQYLSPYYNRREDAFGGDIRGRMTLLTEIVRGVKGEVGRNFPVICRISGEDKSCQITREDAQVVAVELENAGADALEVVSGSMIESLGVPLYTSEVPRGHFAKLSERIKELIVIPVISNIRINDPGIGEKIIQEKKADMVSMSRALIADPEFPHKAASGRADDINRCVACMTCLDLAWNGNHIQCTVNPQTGFEDERQIKPAKRGKKVLVAGGGPAGLEAARIAALRGHRVLLFERESRLGGQLCLAAKPPHKDEIEELIQYLATQAKKHGVTITCGREMTVELVRREDPDVVIVATGASPNPPEIDVVGGTVIFPGDVLCEKADVGDTVVIMGGGLVGAETAEFLACRNRHVSIIEMLDKICADMPMFARDDLLRRLRSMGVNMLTQTKVDRIDRDTVVLNRNGERQRLRADTVVVATGSKANRELAEKLKGVITEVHVIGDCQEPRRIFEAIHEGFGAGNRI